jgi:hypothetical protein
MNIRSTEFLGVLARDDRYIVFERSTPVGRLKNDFITIKSRDGRDLVELPRVIFDDMLAASFIHQDGDARDDHSLIFRLTTDGLERGKAYLRSSSSLRLHA